MSQPGERIWTVDLWGQHPETLEWMPYPPEVIVNSLLELEGTLRRIGGVVQIASRRFEISPGRVETIALVYRWRSFVPLDKAQTAPPIEQDGTAEQAQAQAVAPPPPAELPEHDERPPEFVEAPSDGPVTHDSVVPAGS